MICNKAACAHKAQQGKVTLTCTTGLELRGKAHLNNSVHNRSWTYHTIFYADLVLLLTGLQRNARVHRFKINAANAWMLYERVQFPSSLVFSCSGRWRLLDMWQSTFTDLYDFPTLSQLLGQGQLKCTKVWLLTCWFNEGKNGPILPNFWEYKNSPVVVEYCRWGFASLLEENDFLTAWVK